MSKPLRLAYLIFVHQNPLQLARLLQRLYCSQTIFYIYVDGKEDLASFQSGVTCIPSEQIVWLQNRMAISWGDFSLTAAYLHSFESILQQTPAPDYILTISGQDYPIVSNDTIHHQLNQYKGQTIIDHAPITEDAPHILGRVQQYYLSVKRHHSIIYPHPNPDNIKKKTFNTLLRWSRLFPLPRKMPLNHQLYFGTNWFQLTPIAAQYLVDFVRSNPAYVKFFQTTYVPEESFFHTVLMNATEKERGEICNQRLTYMQWDRPEGAYTLPITKEELPSIFNSGKLFARKFDANRDKDLLDQIDAYVDLIPHEKSNYI